MTLLGIPITKAAATAILIVGYILIIIAIVRVVRGGGE